MTWIYIMIAISIGYLTWKAVSPKESPNPKTTLLEWAQGLTLLTECKGETIQFTYEKYDSPRERRTLDLLAILQDKNGRIYLYGRCHRSQENRTFNIDKITTMLKINSKRVDVIQYLDETYDIQ